MKLNCCLHAIAFVSCFLKSCISENQIPYAGTKERSNIIWGSGNDSIPRVIPNNYVVILKPSFVQPLVITSPKKVNNRLQRFKDSNPKREQILKAIKGLITNHRIKTTSVEEYYADLVVGFSGKLSQEEVRSLKADKNVKGIYQDYAVKFQQQEFALQTFPPNHFEPYEVQRGVSLAGGPIDGSTKLTWIWVIDSGIDMDHPDLNVQRNEPYAVSFTSDTPEDDFGHGTMVAGLAAAKNNRFGTCGVSSGALVVPVKVGAPGFVFGYGAQLSDILAGLNHIAKFFITDDVVNISIASFEGEDCATSTGTLAEEVRNAVSLLGWSGVWVCSGSGNSSDCAGAAKNLTACVNAFRVYTVGAIKENGSCADYSNWGSFVDWAAVGNNFSTYLEGLYSVGEGTSFSTPLVAGIIHAKGGAPVSSGNVNCCSINYRKANASQLSTRRFDVQLELTRFSVRNVRDADGTEDLYGRIDLKNLRIFANRELEEDELWRKSEDAAIHVENEDFNIGERITIASNLTFDELRNMELTIGGELLDDEGPFGSRTFKCQDCQSFDGNYGTRTLRFMNMPTTLASINQLNGSSPPTYQYLRFGVDSFFELNFYESNNRNDGWVKVLFKVRVRPRVAPPQN